jgi:hypothetical protein
VRYSDGAVVYSESDLSSSGFGLSWGHTRAYANTLSQSTGGKNGNSWLVPQWQYLVLLNGGTRLGVIRGLQDTLWFDKVGGDWIGERSIRATLVEDTGSQQFVLSEPLGSVYCFYSFQTSGNLQGSLKSVSSPGGALAQISYDSTGRITKFEQGAASKTVVYDYNYSGGGSQPGGGLGLLQDVTLTINGTPVRRAAYSYYGLASTNGNYNDLEKATVQKWTGSSWQNLRSTYYRYWMGGEKNDENEIIGVVQGLKYILKPQGYATLTKEGYPPETTTNEKIAEYASNYFEYNDPDRSVSKEICGRNTRIQLHLRAKQPCGRV